MLIPSCFKYLELPPKIFLVNYLLGHKECSISITNNDDSTYFHYIEKHYSVHIDNLYETITTINLKHDREQINDNMLRKCTNLRTLILPKNQLINTNTFVNFKFLRILDVSSCKTITIQHILNMKYLHTLSIKHIKKSHHNTNLTMADVIKIIEKCQTLHEFKIGYTLSYKNKKQLSNTYPNIRLI